MSSKGGKRGHFPVPLKNGADSFKWKMKSIPLSYHYGHKWLLKLLVKHLSADINARQPASVTGVTVIPANRILQPTNLKVERQTDGISYNIVWKYGRCGDKNSKLKKNKTNIIFFVAYILAVNKAIEVWCFIFYNPPWKKTTTWSIWTRTFAKLILIKITV